MERIEGRLAYAATDLVDFLTCEHLTSLERAVAERTASRPALTAEETMIFEHGRLHEAQQLERLESTGRSVVRIARPIGAGGYTRASSETRAAIESGVDAIVGATFLAGDFVGIADLLERCERPSPGRSWSYEVADIKLARRAKPGLIVQLCAYSEALARVQGVAPVEMHVILGDGRRESFRYVDYEAYFRALRARFVRSLQRSNPTSPEKLAACTTCRWSDSCAAQRDELDHLSLVAGIRREQIAKLRFVGIGTLAELARAGESERPRTMAESTWQTLHAQARLQCETRTTGTLAFETLPLVAGRGFGLLPQASIGDLYFDMEGDPWFEGGSLEYLWGVSYRDDSGEPVFRPFWGHDRRSERIAFEAFIDFVRERLERFPDAHVYHYAPYETTAIARMGDASAYESLVDALLRAGVFVDLYRVVTQSLRLSTPSYSIKAVEKFYLDRERAKDVQTAMGSVVAYETYRKTSEQRLLDEIEAYNKDDCDSTLQLHRWLLDRKAEIEATGAVYAEPSEENREESPEQVEERAAIDALRDELGCAGEPTPTATPGERAHRLIGALLDYHRREAKPEWRAFFERCRVFPADLVDDPETIGDLIATTIEPRREDRSLAYTLEFPLQRHKFRAGKKTIDPVTRKNAGEILSIEEIGGSRARLVLKRGPSLATTALPQALIPDKPRGEKEQRAALKRIARALLAQDGSYRAIHDVLAGLPPRFRQARPVVDLGAETDVAALVDDLDESTLVIQGPPGTGKTYTGARAIVELLRRGRRIGVAAQTHKAIHNMLAEVEQVAAERGVTFRGLKKSTAREPDTEFVSRTGAIANASATDAFPPGAHVQLIAGTSWLFARADLAQTLDVLVIDEAGQVALADAVVMMGAARNALLLGDPAQLAHVSTGTHPEGADRSVLGHLLGDTRTVDVHRGVFLSTSYRMHPVIGDFVSDLMYDGRLASDASCALQRIVSDGIANGSGLRALAVEHANCSSDSPPEAERIGDEIAALAGARFIDRHGKERDIDLVRDVLVVAPYNAQVSRIRATLAARGLGSVRVGTVDTFQGQEAAIVFYSMTTSSGDDVPRDLEFLFDRNRLNVAISRARAIAAVVYSPALLQIRCTTVEQMQLVNALARLVEAGAPCAEQLALAV